MNRANWAVLVGACFLAACIGGGPDDEEAGNPPSGYAVDSGSGPGGTTTTGVDANTATPAPVGLSTPWNDDDLYLADPRWTDDQVLGGNDKDHPFAGIYAFEDLTIGDDVNLYSLGISQLVIKVRGTLTLGRNASIRVRNGYYPEAPATEIASLDAGSLDAEGMAWRNVLLFPETYGIGGNGGRGGQGKPGKWEKYQDIEGHGGSGGGGGAGGFGGGLGGAGGDGGYGPGGTGHDGKPGEDNGGDGGYGGANASIGEGGGATGLGTHGVMSSDGIGAGGGGGGGNGGPGSSGGNSDLYYGGGGGFGGDGGGGGGYGGGVLYIAARNIVFDAGAPPKFIVNGQLGGAGAVQGEHGAGGLLVIRTTSAGLTESMCSFEKPVPPPMGAEDHGHGYVIGGPQKVFILRP